MANRVWCAQATRPRLRNPEFEGSVLSRALAGSLGCTGSWRMGSSSPGTLSPATSFGSPFPVSLLTKCSPLLVCAHFAWLCNFNWMRGTTPLKAVIWNSAHWGKNKKGFFKISEIVKSNSEAWNKAFTFLGFWVFFSSYLALDLSISSFWNLEILFCSNACFLPVISLSLHSSSGAPGNSTALLTESRRWPLQSLMSLTSFRFRYLTLRLNLTLPSQFSFFVIF